MSPFCTCTPKQSGCVAVVTAVKELGGIELKRVTLKSAKDIPLLKVGRHFRFENGDKVIVARNEYEGKILKTLSREKDHLLLTKGFSGPVVLFQGGQIKSAIDKMLEYTRKPVNKKDHILHCHMGKERMISIHEISGY